MLQLHTFLTAYDPSDLPGGSIDPLGFESGYLFLAEKLLPDMTNVASRPRYLSVLCTAIGITQVTPQMSPREQYLARQESILRLERLWVLANVLASEEVGEDELPPDGIRGIRYARTWVSDMRQKGLKAVDHQYRLLSRQLPYGMIGIYASVADRFRLVDRGTLSLTADLGERLAEAFQRETELPKEIVAAVREEKPVKLSTLSDWGNRSHISGEAGAEEAKCLDEVLSSLNDTRRRMAKLLEEFPPLGADETELERIQRITRAIPPQSENADLRQAMLFVLEYENCYRWSMLVLERLLWLCRNLSSGSATSVNVAQDTILAASLREIPNAVRRYEQALDAGTSFNFRNGLDKLDDVTQFLKRAVAAGVNANALADVVLERHQDVQSGKFDRGRRKMPWVHRQDGRIELTIARGGRSTETTKPEEILPHFYRFHAADQFLRAARGAYATS